MQCQSEEQQSELQQHLAEAEPSPIRGDWETRKRDPEGNCKLGAACIEGDSFHFGTRESRCGF